MPRGIAFYVGFFLLYFAPLFIVKIKSLRKEFAPLSVDQISKSFTHSEKQTEIHASLYNISF